MGSNRKSFLSFLLRPESADAERLLEEALRDGQRRFRTTDPETALQWQRVKNAVEQPMKAMDRAAVRRRVLKPAISVAFVAAAVIIAALLILRAPQSVIYETGRGQQSAITLADSSQVTLNHTSRLDVDFRRSGQGRHVSLRGEALFRVRKDGAPFVVTTDVGTISVLGTEFNVRVRNDELVVAVLRGSVQVCATRNGRQDTVVLAPGEITTCQAGGSPLPPSPIPFAGYPGWPEGRSLFYRTNLVSACAEIESQFDVTIRIENPSLRAETLTGAIDGKSAGAAVSTLARLTGCSYRYENNGYTLY